MIATRIGPDMRMSVVGSPAYVVNRELTQKTPRALNDHLCITLGLPTNDGLYAWVFSKDSESLKVRVTGPVTYNGVYQLPQAATDGFV
jgi:succinyl-CoA synthetase alpha subunit